MNISASIKLASSYLTSTTLLTPLLIISSISFSASIHARETPGWGNAVKVCETPRVGNDDPSLNYAGGVNSFETGFYHIGRLPNLNNLFLSVSHNSGLIGMLPTSSQDPTNWLVTGVGADLYQISTCHNGQPRCLILSGNNQTSLGECAYEAYGDQAWWSVGILLGPGKGGSEFGSDGLGRMDCLTEATNSEAVVLSPCDTSGKPDETWCLTPADRKQTSHHNTPNDTSARELQQPKAITTGFPNGTNIVSYQCESGEFVKVHYDQAFDQAQVYYQNQHLILPPVVSGSGAKYEDSNLAWGWWTKGKQGFIFSYSTNDKEEVLLERCTEIEAHSKPTPAQPILDNNRQWSATGAYEEIKLADCRNCGDDIGMHIDCQGPTEPALVSIYWAASETISEKASLSLEVNGQAFERAAFTSSHGMLGHVPQFKLHKNDPLIPALQKGSILNVTFNDVTSYIGLRGSSSAFSIFKAHCGWNQPTDEQQTNTASVQNNNEVTQNIPSSTPAENNADEASWYAFDYFDEQKKQVINNLAFGIPETDSTALNARCIVGKTNVDLDILIDTADKKIASNYYIRIQTGDFDKTYQGQVFSLNSEYSGVKLNLLTTDPLWSAITSGEEVYVIPQTGSDIILDHSASIQAIKVWLRRCK